MADAPIHRPPVPPEGTSGGPMGRHETPDHEHHHEHSSGLVARLRHALTPHSHDSSESISSTLEASSRGIRAVKLSLIGLGVTAALQVMIVAISGSVALLADTIHNFSDALTAVPLWLAFVVGRRSPNRRYTYGYGRAEDLAGLFVLLMIALSAIMTGYQAVLRLIEPAPVSNLGWVAAAGVIGFVGNEAVAVFRIREGRGIGSAALVADGQHARTDGLTSLAVLLGAGGMAIGWEWADPVVGLLITGAILLVLRSTGQQVFARLLDAVEPELTDQAERALISTEGVTRVRQLSLRWVGHALWAECTLEIDHSAPPDRVAVAAQAALRSQLPRLAEATVATRKPEQTGFE